MHKLSTTQIIIWGLIIAIPANIPLYAWIFNEQWELASGFPLGWVSSGLVYMSVFFHEIGHTIFAWFYGYPAIPTFDFQHGGGMAWLLSGQQIPILVIIWIAMIYGLWAFREYILLQAIIILLALLNITLAFNNYHTSIMNFMGPAFECLIAAFFLYRALFDLAPRGDFERFLNSFFGFAMILQVFVNSYGLLKSDAYRLVYYEQKGSHVFGDFDKVANQIPFLNFDDIVIAWASVNTACLIIPFALYAIRSRSIL